MKNKDEELMKENNPILTDKPIWIDYGDGLGEFLDIKKLRFDENTIEGGTWKYKLRKRYPWEKIDYKVC